MANNDISATEKTNRIAFRASPAEILLLKQLQTDWQAPNLSAVLHKVLATFYGQAHLRAEKIAQMRTDIKNWQATEWELFKKV